MPYYEYQMYQKGTEAGGGGGYPPHMRLGPSGGQNQPQVDPKQPPTPVQQIPMNYQQQQRPPNIYQRPQTPRIPRAPPAQHMNIQSLQTSNLPQFQPATAQIMLHAYPQSHHPSAAVLMTNATQTISGQRHQSHGSGQGAGAGGVPPGSYFPQQLYTIPSQPPLPFPTPYNYMYHPGLRNATSFPSNSGPHPAGPPQPPPQQPPQQFVVDPTVAGSGGGTAPGGGSGAVLMPPHPPGLQTCPPQPRQRRRNAIPIIDPNNLKDITEDIYSEYNQTNSGESSASATPHSLPHNDTPQYAGYVAADFAARVAAVAASDDDTTPPQSTPSSLPVTVNGPSTPPTQQQQPPPPTPPSSAVEINPPPSVLPPQSQLPPPQPQPQSQPQPQPPAPSQPPIHSQSSVQTPAPQSHAPPAPHAHSQPPQIPTVSAMTNSPPVDLPKPKGSTPAHSPGRKATPVPSSVTPVLSEQKKKDKKVAAIGSTLPPHREEPEEQRKSTFAESINIKNLQPTPVPSAQLPSQPQPVTHVNSEPETNGEPEVAPTPPVSAPPPSKHPEKHEQPPQHQPQHETRGKPSQKSKTKKKAHVNRKGQEKEGGSDMDAFTSAAPPPVETRAPSPPAASPAPPAAVVPEPSPQVPVTEVTVQPLPTPPAPPVEKQRQPSPAPLPQSPPEPPAPVSQTILPPSSNKNLDNEKDEGMEDMDDEEIDDESSILVATKNEENAKVSAAAVAETDESIVIETTVIERTKAPSLKYTYKEGQWSPLNPEGKKVYDRDFLLTLRVDDLSNKRPEIEECDILKTDSSNNNNSISANNNNRRMLHGSSSMNMMNRGDGGFAPNFLRSSSSQRGGMSGKRGSQQGRPGGAGGGSRSKGMYPSSQYKSDADEDLHWAPKGWKPDRCKTPPKQNEEDSKTEALYKRVRGILNKLTPQKFDTLMEQIDALPIDTHERLKGVVELVFDKAVDEPSFSRAYAKLCQNLGKLVIKNPGSDGSEGQQPAEGGGTSFRKILLTRCQEMFEKKKKEETGEEGKKSDEERLAELRKQMASEENKEKKKELKIILDEEERKIRVKYVGLARFIGELFKLQMLTAGIMHGCIKTLLEKIEEESLECLCKLLTTVGKELEQQSTSAKGNDLDEYFAKMRKLSQKSANSKVSSRVRFMLQDVIELRTNKWVPRRDENNPKTMEQIQRDAERETLMESAALLQSNTPRSKHSDRDRDDRRRGQRGGNIQDQDGWLMSTNNKFRNTSSIDASKLLHLKGMDNEVVGSLGSSGQFSKWNTGSSASKLVDDKRPHGAGVFVNNNKYAALYSEEKKMSTLMSRKATPSTSLDNKERERALQSVRDVHTSDRDRNNRNNTSNPPSRDNSRIRAKPATTPQTPTEPELPVQREQQPPEDPEVLQKKARVLFEEWLANHNVTESVDSIKAFPDPDFFVKTVMDKVLEGKPAERTAFGELLTPLLSNEVITSLSVSKALSDLIEIGEDLMIDLPFVWKYLAEFLVPILAKGVFSFADLKVACEPHRTSHMAITLSEIIVRLLKEKGPAFIRSGWESSNVKFSDFLPDADVDNFIKTNKCGFLIGEGEVEANEPQVSMSQVETTLYDFLTQDGEKVFDHVCEWIKANVGTKTQDVDFIKALTRAVIRACIKNEKIIPGSLTKHSTLIKKFVDANETRELACLNGILQLIVVEMESPAGVLVEIFQTLNDDGIISHEAFLKWKTSGNDIGKGVAMKSLSSFFVSLSEQDESDEEST